MQRSGLAAATAFFALGIFTAAAQATPSANRLTTDHYFDLERIANAQISPDGARIVYTRQQVNGWRISGNRRSGS